LKEFVIFARSFMPTGHRRLRDCWHGISATRLKSSEDRSESGAALVEFTILAPVFFLITFGIIEFGSIFFVQNTMVNAAREASRSMAVQGLTSAQAQTIAMNYLTGYTQPFTYNIRDNCLDSPKAQEVTVTITTDAASASLVNYLGLFTGKTLSSKVIMRKELAC
jgi:Flp pilus assembly protein TadG